MNQAMLVTCLLHIARRRDDATVAEFDDAFAPLGASLRGKMAGYIVEKDGLLKLSKAGENQIR